MKVIKDTGLIKLIWIQGVLSFFKRLLLWQPEADFQNKDDWWNQNQDGVDVENALEVIQRKLRQLICLNPHLKGFV